MQPIQRLLSTTEAAELLGVSASFLNKQRLTGVSDAIPYIKIGARVAYDPGDLASWLESQKRRSAATASSPAPFADAVVRAAVVAERGDDFARSWIDPADWDADTRMITPRFRIAADKLGELRALFADLGVTVSAPVAGAA